ncbi:MAG: hypothetical protein IKR45_00560 [Treponema sp.]|nr:hypothetical protein [Treponema sp.]
MKRLFSILIILLTFTTLIFAQESDEPATDEDGFPDVYVYDSNGAGDQFLKLALGAIIPLNFQHQLKTGGEATIGYYRFLTKNFALGGEFSATYNQSIGEKILVMIPITFGIMYQPYIGKFEFPLFAQVGLATQTWQNMEIFPTLATKLSAGAFYRISDSISLGLSTDFVWIPQWFPKDPSKNFNGLFETANISLRYHF